MFSLATGDADLLPQTDNVLMVFSLIYGEGMPSTRFVEVTHESPAEVVWDVTIDHEPRITPFRIERMPLVPPSAE